ncbi:MAG: hypothetical protein IPM39_18155 [Chloroflexi bacterium]|nr:hypothetical protein [Chloroflexota bacterium]
MLQFLAMNDDVRQLVQAIHDGPMRLVFVTAGAGTQALSDLLSVAGATRTLLEALVPYGQASFNDFLDQRPRQYVADDTARLMAGRAYTRARWLESEGPMLGLACTATIITDRPKRGEHRAHIAAWQPARLVWHTLRLDKGARDREGEENVVSRLILNCLAEACGLESRLLLPLTENDDLKRSAYDYEQITKRLQRGEVPYFGVHDNGRIRTTDAHPQVLLSGSFNPLHDGHLGMSRAAAQLLGKPVAFELSARNADKPPLPVPTVLYRLGQFAGRYPVYVSQAPTFVEKAQLYPGATFVVGFDTAVRILQPRFYGHSQANLCAALETIREQGCRFLVAGRLHDDQQFHHAADMDIPDGYAEMFQPLPPEQFREDISSTELRQRGAKGSR